MVTNLAPAAGLVNGSIALCVKSSITSYLRFSELRPTSNAASASPWTPYEQVSESPDYAPAVAAFQNELWVFFLQSSKIYARARTATGTWTEKAELPGGGSTNIGVGAAGTPGVVQNQAPYSKELYLFLKGSTSNKHYINMASETGTWSAWGLLDPTSTTDRAIAACVTTASSPKVYLFAKGIGDKKIYWRKTT
jgi:hypothetical protein